MRGLERVEKVVGDRMRSGGDEVRAGSVPPEVPEQIPVYDHGSESACLRPISHHCFSKAFTAKAMLFIKVTFQHKHIPNRKCCATYQLKAPCGHQSFIALLELNLSTRMFGT
jgi:hypothetical protein